MTNAARPDFTSRSVINSPLTVFPALVARPTSKSTLSCLNLFHLLFQMSINFRRNRLLKGALQPFVLHCLLKAVPGITNICPPAVFLSGGIQNKAFLLCPEDPQQLLFRFHLSAADTFAHRYFAFICQSYHLSDGCKFLSRSLLRFYKFNLRNFLLVLPLCFFYIHSRRLIAFISGRSVFLITALISIVV